MIFVSETKGVPCCGTITAWNLFLGGFSGNISLQVSKFAFVK